MIIGSTSQYFLKVQEHKKELEEQGYTVLIPAFDQHTDFGAYEVCDYNYRLMLEADEVHIIWDRRSMGTVFDFGMAFALRKRVKVFYLEKKHLETVMLDWEKISCEIK
ncbi:hypothetical protein A2Z67_00050 [Candidatus Woesebacteria bacterium RBG_13_36_22]|uniref:Uncharacterized protein n=1 Tax=Candidatus Woesebacteria bacterium RBG_13_36_22 TaxID=1802478 RepID=A0A1F7X6D9_9BACT|nr:MAG: hypothetical protein A2Z67_00050 [Candidatus Woesebacteria bacterium RBG_13_36_22]